MISIIIPCYDSYQNLLESLRVLFSEENKNVDYEVLVIDDNSSEDLSKLTQKFPKLRYHKNKENVGPAETRNVGINHAKGDVYLFIDSDVIISPNILEKVENFFKQPENMALVGNVSLDNLGKKFIVDFLTLQVHFNFNSCKSKYFTTLNTEFGAVRKEVIEKVGIFNPKYKQADVEDFELGVRINKHYNIRLDNSINIIHNFETNIRKSLYKTLRRSFFWMEILLSKKKFENAQVTRKRALSALTSFIFINTLFVYFIFNGIYNNIYLLRENYNPLNSFFIFVLMFSFFLYLFLESKFIVFLEKKNGLIFMFKGLIYNLFSLYCIGLGSLFGLIYYSIISR